MEYGDRRIKEKVWSMKIEELRKRYGVLRQKSKEKLKKNYTMNYWEKWKVQIVKDKGLGFRMKMDERGIIDTG